MLYLPRAVQRPRVDQVQPQLLPRVHHASVSDETADESSPVSVLQAARAFGRAHGGAPRDRATNRAPARSRPCGLGYDQRPCNRAGAEQGCRRSARGLPAGGRGGRRVLASSSSLTPHTFSPSFRPFSPSSSSRSLSESLGADLLRPRPLAPLLRVQIALRQSYATGGDRGCSRQRVVSESGRGGGTTA